MRFTKEQVATTVDKCLIMVLDGIQASKQMDSRQTLDYLTNKYDLSEVQVLKVFSFMNDSIEEFKKTLDK